MTGFIQSWKKSKRQGRLKYSIVQGLIFALIVTLIKDRSLIWDILKGSSNDVQTVLIINFSWLLLGATIGYYTIVWWWKEKLYKKEQDKLATTKDMTS